MGTVLIVDGANVVGARPNGWWRDRAGAAVKLHDALLVSDVPGDVVVLVLEGQARAGVKPGKDAHVRVVHAKGVGDDAIVAEAKKAAERGDRATVVTADRILMGRVEHHGAMVLSPAWLLDRLDDH